MLCASEMEWLQQLWFFSFYAPFLREGCVKLSVGGDITQGEPTASFGNEIENGEIEIAPRAKMVFFFFICEFQNASEICWLYAPKA